MVTAERAALDHVVADMVQALARPHGVRQEPVKDPARLRRDAAIQEELSGGLEVDLQGGVQAEAALRPLEVLLVPGQAEPVCLHRRRGVRQVDGDPLGGDELERGREGPADSAQAEVRRSQRPPYGRPRTRQTPHYLARFLPEPGQGPDREKLSGRGCFPHYGDQTRAGPTACLHSGSVSNHKLRCLLRAWLGLPHKAR